MKRLSRMAPLALSALALAVALTACNGGEADDRPDGSADTDTGFDFDTDYPYDLDAGLRCDGGFDVMQPSPDGVGQIPTGIEHCQDDSYHRYTTVPCTTIAVANAECEENGYCAGGCPAGQVCAEVDIEAGPLCECVKPCASDGDCGPDEACACGEAGASATRCLPVDCRTDADCGGFECGLSFGPCGELRILGCHSPSDECHDDAQCTDDDGQDMCHYDSASDTWNCTYSECD